MLARRRTASSDMAGGERLRYRSASCSGSTGGLMISRLGLQEWEDDNCLVRLLATAAYCERFCGKLISVMRALRIEPVACSLTCLILLG